MEVLTKRNNHKNVLKTFQILSRDMEIVQICYAADMQPCTLFCFIYSFTWWKMYALNSIFSWKAYSLNFFANSETADWRNTKLLFSSDQMKACFELKLFKTFTNSTTAFGSVFPKRFCSIIPFSLSTHRCRSQAW